MSKMVKENIIKEIKNGATLGDIVSKFNIPKTTIYYHMKKIRGKKTKDIILNNDSEKIGEFVGIFAGDGNFFFNRKKYEYLIRIFTFYKEEKYAKRIKNLISYLFVNSTVNEKLTKSVIITRVKRKFVYLFLRKYLYWEDGSKTHTVRLIEDISLYDKRFLKGFVRGLIDTDGSVDNYGRIEFTSCSKGLFINAKRALEILGFKPTTWIRRKSNNKIKDTFSAVIKRKELKKYLDTIGFGNVAKTKKALLFAPVV